MNKPRTVEIRNRLNETLLVPLIADGEREGTRLIIEGVSYHFERIRREELLSQYKLDTDPDYDPQMDQDGFCYILAPYSARDTTF